MGKSMKKNVYTYIHVYIGLPRRMQWYPTPALLPGKSHGRRSLEGCSPWGRKESDTTERLHFHFSLSCIGEANGDPLQCSCLENPRDGGACDSMESHRVRHNWNDLAAAAVSTREDGWPERQWLFWVKIKHNRVMTWSQLLGLKIIFFFNCT